MKQYEIWWATLPLPVGRRPVLLLSRNPAYSYLNKVLVAEGSPDAIMENPNSITGARIGYGFFQREEPKRYAGQGIATPRGGLAATPDGSFLLAASFAETPAGQAAPPKPTGVSEDEHAAQTGRSP